MNHGYAVAEPEYCGKSRTTLPTGCYGLGYVEAAQNSISNTMSGWGESRGMREYAFCQPKKNQNKIIKTIDLR